MKYLAAVLGCATLAAAHGYIDNATISNEFYEFYQPYLDPYMNPAVCVSSCSVLQHHQY